MTYLLHCRIGSLEMRKKYQVAHLALHCRIGSLETVPDIL
ncbi:hypothetical protein HMPREF9996_02269 [Aggregatibacter actinomycetemcomitans Y4]|nr:hypothetical protein HMPREF9996_02269 [Aggregatibacter actinomycetemcomitans Y4]